MCSVYKSATFEEIFTTMHLNLNFIKLAKLKLGTFAEKLRYLRIERNLNQREFAKLLNRGFTSVCNWEQGNRIPKTETIKEIAKNIDEKWLKAIECVRLAPSYKDTQPWRFYGDRNLLNIYRKKVGEESTSKIDMGIALRHFDIGCKYHGIEFEYIKTPKQKQIGLIAQDYIENDFSKYSIYFASPNNL